jgi:hypothetical protein
MTMPGESMIGRAAALESSRRSAASLISVGATDLIALGEPNLSARQNECHADGPISVTFARIL